MICRYQEASQENQKQDHNSRHQPSQLLTHHDWKILIKLAAYKNRRSKRSGYAYEAIKLDGRTLLKGGASCGRKLYYLAVHWVQDALVEAILKAKELGFSRILTLSNSRRLEHVCNHLWTPSWQEQTFTFDLNQLQQQGLVMHSIFVPKTVVSHVIKLSTLTTSFHVRPL